MGNISGFAGVNTLQFMYEDSGALPKIKGVLRTGDDFPIRLGLIGPGTFYGDAQEER